MSFCLSFMSMFLKHMEKDSVKQQATTAEQGKRTAPFVQV